MLISPNDPLLRSVSRDFDFETDDPIALSNLLETSLAEYKGLGLSAIQIGIPVRAFVMKTNPDVVCFNPRIVDSTGDTVVLEEGCLSYPGLILKVKRPKAVRVRFTLKNRETVTMKFEGMTARIFQHEMDHLDGVRHVDHVGSIKLMMAVKKAKKYGYNYKIGELR